MKKETFTSIIAGFTERLFSKTTSIKLEFSTLKDGPGPAWQNLEIHNLVMTSSHHNKKMLYPKTAFKICNLESPIGLSGKTLKITCNLILSPCRACKKKLSCQKSQVLLNDLFLKLQVKN